MVHQVQLVQQNIFQVVPEVDLMQIQLLQVQVEVVVVEQVL
tara:strand:- start:23 stop:145 length:123 start_codon:yes stop_codon:yes gene_type:complete